MDYLPKDATIEEACNWLQAKTGQTWVFARLLECHLRPYFWLDYKPGYPVIYGEKIEGYQTRMMFQGDLHRLESDRGDALVNMFTAHDGTLVKVQPGLRVPLSELKFKREDVERSGRIINKTAEPQAAAPAPVVADSASNAPLDAPQPVTTGDVAHAFDGLRRWNEKAWKDTLGSPPKWLEACIALRGERGKGRPAGTLFLSVLRWCITVTRRRTASAQGSRQSRSYKTGWKRGKPTKLTTSIRLKTLSEPRG